MCKTLPFCSENFLSITSCSCEKRYQALLTLLCASSTITMTTTTFCNKNSSFIERVVWISVETRPRGNEATCIVSGCRGTTSYKFILHTCLQKHLAAELNQRLTKKTYLEGTPYKALKQVYKNLSLLHFLPPLPFIPSILSHSLCPSSSIPPFPTPLPPELNAGLVGLGLTYTVSLAGMFQYCVRQSAEVENIVRDSMCK